MKSKTKESWGHEETIAHTSKYIVKKLSIRAGQKLKRRFHLREKENVYVDEGVLLLDLSESEDESNVLKLESGKFWQIYPKKVYRFCAPSDQNVVFFTITTPEKKDVFYFNE